jgi:outer membrane protein, multidrug efflux system
MIRHRWLAAALLAAGALMLASCLKKPDRSRPPVDVPAKFSASGASAAPAKWWMAFEDSELDRLVEEALAGNMRLRTAWDRLAQAAAVGRKAGAPLWPELTAGGGASRTRTVTETEVPKDGSSAAAAAAAAAAGMTVETRTKDVVTYRTDLALNVAASYELDLWGRVRSTRRAALADAAASREDLDAAAMSLSAEVATTWYRLVKQRAQLDLLKRQEKVNRNFLGLTELRFKLGRGTAVDVLQQRQQLEAVRGDASLARMRKELLEHQLAVLLGRPPKAGVARARVKLPALPTMPAAGLPSELIARRPDVRAAFLRLGAADHRVAAGIADRFPRISLTARSETSAGQLRDLFDNWLASMAANILAPIFDAGRRKAEVQRARAAASEKLHAYGGTVLGAFREVEDAMTSERRGTEYLTNVSKRVKLAGSLTTTSRQRYANGGSDYLPVLIALRAEQNLEKLELAAQLSLIEYRIGLYRALGGAWELKPSSREDDTGEQK